MFETVEIDSLAFHEVIVSPSFQDLIPTEGDFNGILNEFTLMDNVISMRPIINIKKMQNIMQRRDASCNIVYKQVMGTDNRNITTVPLVAATKNCANEFYQGALEDWRNGDTTFNTKIQPFFLSAVRTDLASNAYFGDVARVNNPAAQFSTNMYDGIFKWIRQYYAAGIIPASQGFTMPTINMRMNPTVAYNVIKTLYDRQSPLLRAWAPLEKAFYVSQPILDGYREYLKLLGNGDATTIEMYRNGVKVESYEGIPIYVDPLWEPILLELYGDNKNAAVLTIRGNFVFATDKNYGEGPNNDEALRVWYEEKDMTWYFRMFLKAGTQIALPEHIVFALPN